jgi:hypothetical protein
MNKDDKAKRLVVRTLKSPENQKIKVFLFGGHGFSGGLYSNVAQAIDDGLIDAEYDYRSA